MSSVNLRQKLLLYLIKAYLSKLGRYNQAIIYFDKALNRNPNYADALHGKTEALAKIKLIGTDITPLIFKYHLHTPSN
jgi:tetratricopeptide (TPR) repeat protein